MINRFTRQRFNLLVMHCGFYSGDCKEIYQCSKEILIWVCYLQGICPRTVPHFSKVFWRPNDAVYQFLVRRVVHSKNKYQVEYYAKVIYHDFLFLILFFPN
jgi:hypothetical protein